MKTSITDEGPRERITERSRALLDALRKSGDYMSRADLARATGKNRLSPHDFMLLERMEKDGLIEIRQRDSRAPAGVAFDYRAKGE